MQVLIITPPLVQLNSPYPSGAYLSSYFKSQGFQTLWQDLNIKLYYSIFSRQGLTKLFELSQEKALQIAQKAEKDGDQATAFNLRRYISTKESWIKWIDFINQFLCSGGQREKEHEFLYSPFAPRGNRMLSYLENLNHEVSVDDVKILASLALADLSDYITVAFDKNFSLIRYAESLAVDERSFSQIQKELDSPIMENFYQPVLQELFGPSGSPLPSGFCCKSSQAPVFPRQSLRQESSQAGQSKVLICISIPFAGTLLPALYTARFFKNLYKEEAIISIGGGFVNTELRNARSEELANYVDIISYDRGYGSYYQYFNQKENNSEKKIYKLRQFIKNEAGIKVIEAEWENKEIQKIEDAFTSTICPDYSDIDFSIYPRVSDDINPMHRLWTDGAWIKAYLAHGCYWHKCAFCDTQLDYVCAYKPVGVKALYQSLAKTSQEKNIYGIHFVDEALPPSILKEFALQNLKNKESTPLYYWGNIRFEKAFTKDLAAFLSAGGFAAVSAGLEVATGSGLKNINKGTDIESIVSACAAFKEAGILVHAYMIYGFWNDSDQSIIDSMETLRQFFQAGLLDSAFWHKFVLTRNSQVYTDWKNGLQKDLQPIEAKVNLKDPQSMFAQNNLHFKGEEYFEKFGKGLETALNSWMHGQALNTKVQKWFDFPLPAPRIPKNYIENLINLYEEKNSKLFKSYAEPCQKELQGLYWIASQTVISGQNLSWFYLQEEFSISQKEINPVKIQDLVQILNNLNPQADQSLRSKSLESISSDKNLKKLLELFHNQGLVCI
ncbi:MAG: radical SAM protein [Treponema sp.]|nr:radical SAM protein [Treponema sp.]